MGEVGHAVRPEPGERGVEHRQFDVLAPGPAFSSKEGRRDRLGDRVGGGLVGDQGADKVGEGSDSLTWPCTMPTRPWTTGSSTARWL